jgi:Mn2+/Fe2+ NRAMP family transporter
MVVMLLIATNRKVMGHLVLPFWLRALGWLATLAMAAASVAFLVL